MPLVKTILETGIKTKIKALEKDFIKKLDGGTLDSQSANAETISEALVNISSKSQALSSIGASFDINLIQSLSSNEWANAIAKQVITLLADEVSKIVADEVDKYIKTATIIDAEGRPCIIT